MYSHLAKRRALLLYTSTIIGIGTGAAIPAHAAPTTERTWTFTNTEVSGGTRTYDLKASYLRTNGFDSPLGQKYVVLQLSDGRTKSYPLRNFSPEDKAYVQTLPPISYAPDPDVYAPKYTEYDPVRDAATVLTHETPHFVFYWGKKITPEAHNWDNAAFREMNFNYFEDIWNFNAQMMHAPMPYVGQAQKYKINVYISGTGLSKHPDGFAYGGESVLMHPGALLEGSSVVPHEFTHVIQFYSGGFRDNPDVGWFWECHANWNCFQFYPSYPAALGVYAERMHYELSSSRMNYGSWPFLQYMAEDPKLGPKFCFDIWKQNRRDENGASLETPFQTIMRVGAEQGKFKGDGIEGFGDVVGGMAAHNVTWDYVNQYSMRRELETYFRSLNRPTGDRTVLRELPDKPNTFTPLYSQAPRQYGINIVDLVRQPNADSVTVNFQGIVDETEGSDWRATLVAVDATGKARYSPMWRRGSQNMRLQPDERVSLAIAATPSVFHVQPFRPGYNRKPRFDYEVSFGGASPAPCTQPALSPRQGAAHPNGGGFVEEGATVAATAYVGPNARVLGRAQVSGYARIEDNAVVRDEAQVADNAIVGGYAVISNRAKIGDEARVRDNASVGDSATLGDHARVLEYARIQGDGRVGGDALIKGFGEVYTSPGSPIGGGVIMGEDLEVHTGSPNRPINYGLVYGFNDPGILETALQDNHYLYAHWDFNTPRKNILLDAFADNNGVLRGTPALTFGDGSLHFTGNGQYALVGGSVVDTNDITIDLRLNWAGGPAASQRVFSFGDAQNVLYFTPKDDTGHAAFVITKDGVSQTLRCPTALPVNKTTRVSIVLRGDTGTLSINGQPVATSTAMILNPEDIAAKWGTIGADAHGQHSFKGSLDDVAIYRTGFATLPTALP